MKVLFILSLVLLFSCSKEIYLSDGATIYRTGKNKHGKKLLDKEHSQITFVKSCQGCHGKQGERNKNCSVKWSSLSDPKKHTVPYTDSLFYRFLDKDLKSDGSLAETGVHWTLSGEDKKELLDYLKKL
ncbi:hypothetical protein CNR22_16330 [Sphingobacteriaceae bacterium]|nr:hypothetical protein CNR22_16330 [Sphingobacteriaceae bacterium]